MADPTVDLARRLRLEIDLDEPHERLRTGIDPELGVKIVDLGLIDGRGARRGRRSRPDDHRDGGLSARLVPDRPDPLDAPGLDDGLAVEVERTTIRAGRPTV